MNTSLKAIAVGLLLLVGLLAFSGISTRNSLITLDEGVKEKWGTVRASYQRRSDLIPNIVATVKGAAEFEQGTLEAVVNARANATKLVLPEKVTDDPEAMKSFLEAQNQITGSLSRLLATFEAYPDLKTNQSFNALITELEGTENRINVARRDFNEAVKAYNSTLRKFPANVWAGLFGFSSVPYFEGDQGIENAPKVEF